MTFVLKGPILASANIFMNSIWSLVAVYLSPVFMAAHAISKVCFVQLFLGLPLLLNGGSIGKLPFNVDVRMGSVGSARITCPKSVIALFFTSSEKVLIVAYVLLFPFLTLIIASVFQERFC